MTPSPHNNSSGTIPQIVDCTMIAAKPAMSTFVITESGACATNAALSTPRATTVKSYVHVNASQHEPSSPDQEQLTPTKPKQMTNNSTANRFTAAQRDRTLRHHKLLQPTSSQEKLHLARLRAERHIKKRSSSSVSLLTLLEEEDDLVEEIVESTSVQVYQRTSSIDEAKAMLDDVCINFKSLSSTISHSTVSTASMSDISGPSDEEDSDQEDEECSVHSPYPAVLKSSHSLLCQPCELHVHSPSHRFVVCADTQFGITKHNLDWDAEIQYSNKAIDTINAMDPRPAFVCMCGDLVDMEFSLERKKGCKSRFPSSLFNGETGIASREVCDAIQDEQNEDFKRIWSRLHPDIALVCLCGNHDLGNRPTPRSISRFRAAYGDEYLAFWVNGTYNICVNNVLFVDPSGGKRIFKTQMKWLEERLRYAQDYHAKQVYVFGHHPWFLYDEEEEPESLTGASPYPQEWKTSSSPSNKTFPDSYFSMPKKYRSQALELFEKYNVDACFSGHFHQNLVSKTRWGMDMIITGPLSVVFDSTGNKIHQEKEDQDHLRRSRRKMTFESEEAMLLDDSGGRSVNSTENEPNCRGVRVVDVHVNESLASSGFSHWFVPL
ncbi:hypothetical protein ACHAXN_011863 [Cyclotella atomus]